MKLKDLLVKYSDEVEHVVNRIENIWNDQVLCLTQDTCGYVCFWKSIDLFCIDGDWGSKKEASLLAYESIFNGEVAEDCETAIIKKEDYLNMVNKKDIYKVAFQTNTVSIEKIQLLYDIQHKNSVFKGFKSALEQSTCHNRGNDNHITFLNDTGVIDGSHGNHLGLEIVPFDKFYDLFKGHYETTEVVKKTPSPRFHKKRIAVPVRKKVDVVVKYKDGSKYSFKDVVYWNATENCFYVKERKVVSEGIESSIGTYIDKKYIQSVNIKEIDGPVNIVSVTDFWYYGDSSKFFGEGLFSKSY